MASACASLLSPLRPARAQVLIGVPSLDRSPDLVVAIQPSPYPPTAVEPRGYVEINVSHLPPAGNFGLPPASDIVSTHVDLTGLVPLAVRATDPGFSCWANTVYLDESLWSTIDCRGDLAWGATTTIHIYYETAHQATAIGYCLQPMYVDASVGYSLGGVDRSPDNNRSISRILQTDCIG